MMSGGWGQKVVFKPSSDSFAVGRRQKALKSFLHSLTICDKVASGNKNKNKNKEKKKKKKIIGIT
jgi:hypothetical protein